MFSSVTLARHSSPSLVQRHNPQHPVVSWHSSRLTAKWRATGPALRAGDGCALMLLPGSGSVILIQLFSAWRRRIKRRGREDTERAHRESRQLRETEISVLGQSSAQSLGLPCASSFFCNAAPWGDMKVVCLTELWWNGYWQAVCTMPWKQSELAHGGRIGGGGGGTTHPALPKGLFPATFILMRNLRPDPNRPRWEHPVQWAERWLLFCLVLVQPRSTACITTVGKCGRSWSVKSSSQLACWFFLLSQLGGGHLVNMHACSFLFHTKHRISVCTAACVVFLSAVHHAVRPGAFSVSGEEPDPHQRWGNHEENQTWGLLLWRRGLEKCVPAG